MKEEALAFQSIPLLHQNRFEERVSFLYLEYARVVQSETGVEAWRSGEHGALVASLQIPVGGLAVLALGPGTSITQAAATSAARSGCTILFTGGGGFPRYSSIAPLTSSSKWAIAQAKVVSDHTLAKKVAKRFYQKQFGEIPLSGSITQMRGMEGSLMRKVYQTEARRARIKGWRRDTKSDDQVNVALNICNSLLYGLSAGVCQSLAMSPSLGVIHRGNVNSFLFDLADFYKAAHVIPLAFSLANEDPEDVPGLARNELRKIIHSNKLMKDLFVTLTDTFGDYLPENEHDRLIGTSAEVEAHRNYGK